MNSRRIVTKEEFDDFIDAYPAPLTKDVAGIFEPPLLTYNDFSSGKVWPASVVASVVLNESYAKDGEVPYRWSPNEYRIDVVGAPK